MKMLGLMFLMVSLVDIWCVRSGCFLPDEMPPFTVGLDTSATNETAEVEEFEDWESTMEEHLFSYMLSSTNLDEFIECYSDSVTVNFSDGAGSAMGVDEYRVVSNTYDELVSNFTVKDGSAEFIDENTIEVKFLQKSSGQFGFMRGLVPWIGEKMDSDGSVEWETWTTLLFRIDDDGLIEQFTIASPQFIREILGAIESLYSGPSGHDLGSTSETLNFFNFTMDNAIAVKLAAFISVMTTLVALCVFVSTRISATKTGIEGADTVKASGLQKWVNYTAPLWSPWQSIADERTALMV
jgi:hypothetical protein